MAVEVHLRRVVVDCVYNMCPNQLGQGILGLRQVADRWQVDSFGYISRLDSPAYMDPEPENILLQVED